MRRPRMIGVVRLTAALLGSPIVLTPVLGQRPVPHVDAALAARTPAGVRPRAVQLVLVITPGWHIGAAPGASAATVGLPTKVTWTVPPGWQVVREHWPRPERRIDGRDTLLTYTGRVEIDVLLDAPPAVPPGSVRARVAYGACRDVCVPGWIVATLDP